jgi:hypothetical protein
VRHGENHVRLQSLHNRYDKFYVSEAWRSSVWGCATLLQLYTSMERLKSVYTSLNFGQMFFKINMVLLIIYSCYIYSFYLELA